MPEKLEQLGSELANDPRLSGHELLLPEKENNGAQSELIIPSLDDLGDQAISPIVKAEQTTEMANPVSKSHPEQITQPAKEDMAALIVEARKDTSEGRLEELSSRIVHK